MFRLLLSCLLVLPVLVHAQTPSSAEKTPSSAEKTPSIAEKTKGMTVYPGYLPFYWEEKTGKVFLEINKPDTELLYQISLPAGLGSNDVGLDRGLLGNTAIIKFTRVGNKVLMVQPNYSFRALSPDPAERRSVEQSFAQSVLWGFTVEAVDHDTSLIDVTPFLFRDAMGVAARLKNQGSYNLDVSRSAMYLERTKNFPFNTELETTVTFTNGGDAGPWVSEVTPNAAAVTLRVHHSFVRLPDNHYTPRVMDPRAGYFSNTYYDYATPYSGQLIQYFICRHRLEKKDPNAVRSEPVTPIVYYVDKGAPEPVRSALLEGARWWNQAFEAAGYINAFRVEVLPDSADPMDIRYNMINWVHRYTRGWSYGASVVDPRTGEIIKGNVTLGSLRGRQDYLIATGLLAPYGAPIKDDKMMRMVLARLRQLAAHEVGHTLGLLHNYIASAQGRASVMDYPPPRVLLDANGDIDLDSAYAVGIGAWDKVSIAYGYSEFAPGTDEHEALNNILMNAAKNGLTFISDRDARDPAGLHPNAHLWDDGADPVAELQRVMQVRAKALSHFGENNIPKGTPMAFLEDVLVPVYLFHRYQLEAVTKEVGGMFYTYALRGDGQVVTRALSLETQLRALHTIMDCMDPKALALPDNIIKLIPPRPDGYPYTRELFNRRTGLAFDPLGAAETAADLPLSFLFNTERLSRMEEYHAEYGGLGAGAMMDTLVKAFWAPGTTQGLSGLIRFQNRQLLLTYLLDVSVNTQASFPVRAAALKAIEDIKKISDHLDRGEALLTLDRIKSPDKAKPSQHLGQPPGSPIGDDEGE